LDTQGTAKKEKEKKEEEEEEKFNFQAPFSKLRIVEMSVVVIIITGEQ
jgi:hypothetical protein